MSLLKNATEFDFLMGKGKEFHSTGPAMEKAVSINCFFEDGVTTRVVSIVDLVTGPDKGEVLGISNFEK